MKRVWGEDQEFILYSSTGVYVLEQEVRVGHIYIWELG